MSNQNTLYLNSGYGVTQELSLLDKQVIGFLTSRGHAVINLNLYQVNSASAVFEKTLSNLKTKPLLITVVEKATVLPIVLIALAFQQGCRCVVFAPKPIFKQFEILTNKNLDLYTLEDKDAIINTLKLYQL